MAIEAGGCNEFRTFHFRARSGRVRTQGLISGPRGVTVWFQGGSPARTLMGLRDVALSRMAWLNVAQCKADSKNPLGEAYGQDIGAWTLRHDAG